MERKFLDTGPSFLGSITWFWYVPVGLPVKSKESGAVWINASSHFISNGIAGVTVSLHESFAAKKCSWKEEMVWGKFHCGAVTEKRYVHRKNNVCWPCPQGQLPFRLTSPVCVHGWLKGKNCGFYYKINFHTYFLPILFLVCLYIIILYYFFLIFIFIYKKLNE